MKELPCERRRRRSKHIDVIVNDLREFLCPACYKSFMASEHISPERLNRITRSARELSGVR